MGVSRRKLRAIDLYSGVGGWSLGLKMAGVDVVASYECWAVANQTNEANNGHKTHTVNLRSFAFKTLPDDIDIVVGSPPCTQFSFSNRGGGGDLEDGLKDIILFLSVVAHTKPRFWCMENVPRVKEILERELRPGGRLQQFAKLNMSARLVNMAEFGLPQRRLRCIAGNIDFDLLFQYRSKLGKLTLGQIVKALNNKLVVDPIYGTRRAKENVTDHLIESPLNAEEERINRATKQLHPVYNRMAFPDRLDRSVRTITATCTRVSRESIVIANPKRGRRRKAYRRLTLRERASLQGFPITFKFFGKSYSSKLKMIGNAMPPVMAFYLARAMQKRPVSRIGTLKQALRKIFSEPDNNPVLTAPDKAGNRYPWSRTFRFAIPSVRLKSGVRFELANSVVGRCVEWQVLFFFGSSKQIHEILMDSAIQRLTLKTLPKAIERAVTTQTAELRKSLEGVKAIHLQRLWSHRGPGTLRPFQLLDRLNDAARRIEAALKKDLPYSQATVTRVLKTKFGKQVGKLAGVQKLLKNAPTIVAGLLVGSVMNGQVAAQFTSEADVKARKSSQY